MLNKIQQTSYNQNNKIWIDNIESLFSSFNIFPKKENSKEENFNNISRMLIVLFLVFFIIQSPKDIKSKKHIEIMIIFFMSLILLIGFYFGTTKKEYFKELNNLSSINNNNNDSNLNIKMDTPPVYKYPLLQTSKAMNKLSPTPIIYPRSHDREIWSYPSYKHSHVNDNSMGFNLTDEYEPLNYIDEFDPRVNTYRNDFGLLNLNEYCNKQNGNKNVSNVSNVSNISNIPMNNENTTQLQPQLQSQEQSQQPIQGGYGIPSPPADWTIKVDSDKTPISLIKERYNYNKDDQNKTLLKYIPLKPGDDMSERRPEITLANNEQVAGFLPNEMIEQTVFLDQKRLMEDDKLKNQAAHMYTTNPNALPPKNLLINKTPISMYGPGMVNVPERTKYTQNIQPNIYSFSDTAEPINANMGISYNPDLPPRVVDQVAMYDGAYPLYHRIDPQLVREGGIPKGRLEEMPRRTQWSAKYNTYDTIDGSVNFEDIYDPRFTGYGDEYRSYVDINLGNVQYYYSDIDAYRDPNFGTRSKVDFIDFVDPMGRIKPEYSRDVGLNDVKETVQTQYDADSIYFREDLMERLMRKRNQELWQLRAAPLRKDAHAHFSSGM